MRFGLLCWKKPQAEVATGALGMDRSLGSSRALGALGGFGLMAVFRWPLQWLYLLDRKEQMIPAPPEPRCAMETWEQT